MERERFVCELIRLHPIPNGGIIVSANNINPGA
jgi:hypothetical protein